MSKNQYVKALFGTLFATLIVPIHFSHAAPPIQIQPPGEKLIIVDPNEHYWAAYDPDGYLVKSGLASAGADWCKDIKRPCHTRVGVHKIRSLGSANCKSPSFPLPKGGAPMNYCMYFNETQALHGSPQVVAGNISHGCIRMKVSEAKWLRYHFAEIGTTVIIKPYLMPVSAMLEEDPDNEDLIE